MVMIPVHIGSSKEVLQSAASTLGSRSAGASRQPSARSAQEEDLQEEEERRKEEKTRLEEESRIRGSSGDPLDYMTEDPALARLRLDYVTLLKDFENYKRHAEVELRDARARGRDELLETLIPVISELQAAARSSGRDSDAMRQGIDLILRKLDMVLAGNGYERIETDEAGMDPRLHEAVAAIPVSGAPEGRILSETAPGYTRDGKLVVPARVVVAASVL